MSYIKIYDLNLFYEEYGKGEIILFLHSHFSRGVIAFADQIQYFSEQYHCLYPDFRGHGKTTCDSLDWNSRMIADDMAKFIDALNVKSVHIVGYSCGAYVGCYMAAKYPDKIKSLVTIGGGAFPRPEGAENFIPENLIKKGETAFIEDMKIRHQDAHRGDWQTYLRNTVEDWKNHPCLSDEEWNRIKCPAFFINGENDPFGTCVELQEKVPHAKIYEVKSGGHRPHFVGEQAEEINAMIKEFIEDIA